MLGRKFLGTSYAQVVNDNYFGKKNFYPVVTALPEIHTPKTNSKLSLAFNTASGAIDQTIGLLKERANLLEQLKENGFKYSEKENAYIHTKGFETQYEAAVALQNFDIIRGQGEIKHATAREIGGYFKHHDTPPSTGLSKNPILTTDPYKVEAPAAYPPTLSP